MWVLIAITPDLRHYITSPIFKSYEEALEEHENRADKFSGNIKIAELIL